jgi:hypothetical protein
LLLNDDKLMHHYNLAKTELWALCAIIKLLVQALNYLKKKRFSRQSRKGDYNLAVALPVSFDFFFFRPSKVQEKYHTLIVIE